MDRQCGFKGWEEEAGPWCGSMPVCLDFQVPASPGMLSGAGGLGGGGGRLQC